MRLALGLLFALAACGDDGGGGSPDGPAAGCGDGQVAGTEQCDDGNDVAGDGCEADCTFSCQDDGECADSSSCTADACDPGTHRCGSTPLADGSACDVDNEPLTREICRGGMCLASMCGDGVVDERVEECDDSNTTPGDGCEAVCAITRNAYRAVSLRFADPHTYTDGSAGCEDGTAGFDTGLQDQITAFELNILLVFKPLDQSAATNDVEIVFGADCLDASPRPSCTIGDGMVTAALARNQSTGTCYTADPTTLNTLYTPPNAPAASCFVTDARPLSIPFGTVALPFQDAVAAATYEGGPPASQLVTGVFAGFLTEADASTIEFAPGFPLYRFLAAAGATGSSCSTEDDRDLHGGTPGFWVYLDLEAAPVDWTVP